MKVRLWITVLSVLLIPAMTCIAADDADSPAVAVEAPVKRFLDFYFHEYRRGLPSKSQIPDLASFVTPELLDLFVAAMAGEDCYAKKNNYEGPPAIEGDLFSSLFEGGTSATYQLVDQKADRGTVEIKWTHDDKNIAPEPFVWKDRVFLDRAEQGWLIADFAHLGTWDFMIKGNVSQVLDSLARECDE